MITRIIPDLFILLKYFSFLTLPLVHALFVSGNHVIRRSKSGSFNNVCSDLGLQQSIVKDSKSTNRVIIGISWQESATLKWYLTVHIRGTILRNSKQFCDLNDIEEPIYRSLNKPSIIKDEQDIQSITSVITDRFRNPFWISVDREGCERPDLLINMATGVVASEEVTKDLLTYKEIGRKALEDYTKIKIQNQSVSVTNQLRGWIWKHLPRWRPPVQE